MTIDYSVTVGEWSVNSSDDPRTELMTIDTTRSVNSPTDACRLSVFASDNGTGGPIDQAAAAASGALGLGGSPAGFSTQIRGSDISPGTAMSVELTSGDHSATVLTAEVEMIETTLGQMRVVGATGARRLASARLNRTYEEQSLPQIVADLAGSLDLDTGDLDGDVKYPYLAMDETRPVYDHILEMARRESLDVYFGADNRLNVGKFDKTGADHILRYGAEVLAAELVSHRPTSPAVRVTGDGSSGSRGSSAWHWLLKDAQSVQSQVGDEVLGVAVQDGAIRTKDAADRHSAAALGRMRDSARWGRATLLGNPGVDLGDAIEIRSAPSAALNQLFKVTSVRHLVSREAGYVTLVELGGIGGANELSGPMGGLSL